MKFNEKIVRLRKIKGITQDEFASAVGVSRQAVSKWDCGQSYPEVAKLLEIKLLFGISIDDLLDESYEIALPEKKKRKRLPKTEKKVIEEEVKKEILKETETIEASEDVKIAVEETPAAPAPVVEEAPVVIEKEPVTVSAPVEKEGAKEVEAPKTEAKEESAKKVGFFGRIFGRK